MIGQVIGSYRIVAELGRGGMGMVYRAEHVQLGRPAALKMLLPMYSTEPAIVQRFFNEARAASAIDHPGIVEIYDFGTHTDGAAYIVMALLKGESLEHRLARGRMSPTEGATILAQVASALAAAHARGIVHRDLKPDNIFLVPNEMVQGGVQAKLLDFGIAKLADDRGAGVKTQTGALIGTPAYMSPEQCMGRADIDHRTDLYSLGCILFHVLCGRPPFVSDQGTGVMIAAHLRDAPPEPRSIDPTIPPALAMITLKLLEKEPAARFQTALEVRDALIGAGANVPVTKAPVGAPIDQYGATIAPTSGMRSPSGYEPTAMPSGASRPGAPSTFGAAAGQVSAPAAPSTHVTRRSKAPWIALALVGAVGIGIGVFAALGGGKSQTSDSQAAGSQAAGSQAAGSQVAASEPAIPQPAKPMAGSGTGSGTGTGTGAAPLESRPVVAPPEVCPPGQTERPDTQGHCCWPDQAWSESKQHCVGAPACPSGMVAKAEACVPDRKITQLAAADRASSFRLDSKHYAPGAKIAITFDAPVHSPTDDRSWITVSEAGTPPSSYGTWTYLDDNARKASLEAPKQDGAYEVRLHTNYPKKSFNVKYAVPFKVQTAQVASDSDGITPLDHQRFSLAKTTVAAGAPVQIAFPEPMRAADGEKFWVTIVEAGAAATSYGAWEYVPANARSMSLAAPANAGAYEVRLHANYPTKSTNVVFGRALTVTQ